MPNRIINFFNRYFILLICLIFILIFFLNFSFDGNMNYHNEEIPIIAGDGVGYYDHLPFYIIRGEFSFENLAKESELTPYWNKYNIGGAVMVLPFFLLAHLLTYIFNFPSDGYSILYQYSAGLAGLTYSLLGVVFLKKVLNKHFSEGISLLTLTAIIFGTNLLYYSTIASTMSHAFSFFLVSVLILLVPTWYKQPDCKNTFLLSLICGLLILVRLNNALFLFIFLLYGISEPKEIKEKLLFFKDNMGKIGLMILIIAVIFVPQLITWKLTYNSWFVFTYAQEKLSFSSPRVAQVLFSLRRGLFFWSPVLLISIFGFPLIQRKIKKYFLAIFIFFPLFIYMNSSMSRWWFGASFGHRGFVEIFPLLALPLALVYDSAKTKRSKVAITIITTLFIIYSLIQMYLYWWGFIPFDEITMFSYLRLFID